MEINNILIGELVKLERARDGKEIIKILKNIEQRQNEDIIKIAQDIEKQHLT